MFCFHFQLVWNIFKFPFFVIFFPLTRGLLWSAVFIFKLLVVSSCTPTVGLWFNCCDKNTIYKISNFPTFNTTSLTLQLWTLCEHVTGSCSVRRGRALQRQLHPIPWQRHPRTAAVAGKPETDVQPPSVSMRATPPSLSFWELSSARDVKLVTKRGHRCRIVPPFWWSTLSFAGKSVRHAARGQAHRFPRRALNTRVASASVGVPFRHGVWVGQQEIGEKGCRCCNPRLHYSPRCQP